MKRVRTAMAGLVAATLCLGAQVSAESKKVPGPSSGPEHQAGKEVPTIDILSRMFIWWNGAFTLPGSYTEEAFSAFFTSDATLTLNGRRSITGVVQWAERFQDIQALGGEVEIVVPFKVVFTAEDKIYTYHVIRSRRAEGVGCMLAAGHATVRDGLIASIDLVRSELTPEQRRLEPLCWQS